MCKFLHLIKTLFFPSYSWILGLGESMCLCMHVGRWMSGSHLDFRFPLESICSAERKRGLSLKILSPCFLEEAEREKALLSPQRHSTQEALESQFAIRRCRKESRLLWSICTHTYATPNLRLKEAKLGHRIYLVIDAFCLFHHSIPWLIIWILR